MACNGDLPELLAPAGSPDALDAAIEAGADAVYFGAGDFNARMRAKNFTPDELSAALRKCAEYGVKSYVTVNTRLRDAETASALELSEKLYLDGASALIVADAGLASAIRRRIPSFEIHASTQMSGHSSRDAEALARLGFSRMVCPREMSYQEIKSLCESSPIEIEMFIHGAHCVSFSGQCLMSFALGGRSGNRGMCAQPCRLPFSIGGVDDAHPLSLKDMCLAGNIREIIDSGVSSLKIEGRQKGADYVYEVVRIYRRLLDERRCASPDEMLRLSAAFSRSGFTNGYFTGDYRGMLGIRRDDDVSESGAFTGLKRKIPIDVRVTAKVGERAEYSITDGKRRAAAVGSVVRKRETGEPMSPDAAREKAGRLGNTAFVLRDFSFETDGDASFSLSELNALRREAVRKTAFPEERTADDFRAPDIFAPSAAKGGASPIRTAEFPSFSRIPDEAFDWFDRIYVPVSDARHADGEKICLCADPLTYDPDYPELDTALAGYTGEILVHGFGQASFARAAGAAPAASFRFNVLNASCAREVLKFADSVTISPEAPAALCRDVGGVASVIVYGRLPLMHTERCMMSDGGAACPFGGAGGRRTPPPRKRAGEGLCKTCDGTLCSGSMTDRTGAVFPIAGMRDCSNMIYNSVPIYMADRQDVIEGCGAARHHFIFTSESKTECAGVIDAYKNKLPPPDARRVRRVKLTGKDDGYKS